MITEAPRRHHVSELSPLLKHRIAVFHCCNSLRDTSFLEDAGYEVQSIKLPCSSMVREVVLLKAFEAGADAVLLAVCPAGTCRYLQGNLRAAKRVARLKNLMDGIGLDGRRLNIVAVPHHGDCSAVKNVVDRMVQELKEDRAKAS